MSFKAATDDLRESPQVQLAKRLLGEGRDLKIWDDNVSLGHLIGSNRQYIEEVIPHIGSLLCQDLETALAQAEVVIIGTRGIDRATLSRQIRPGQFVIDLVNLEKARRIESNGSYEGHLLVSSDEDSVGQTRQAPSARYRGQAPHLQHPPQAGGDPRTHLSLVLRRPAG